MIDEKYQGHGYGKEAICLALEFIRSFPCGKRNIVIYRTNLKM